MSDKKNCASEDGDGKNDLNEETRDSLIAYSKNLEANFIT